MEKPSLEVVVQTLDALYRQEDTFNQEKASAWLSQLQSSVHAWEIADQLLVLNRDVETSYFAAQTMKNKIRYFFEELPVSTHQVLRDTLLCHMRQLCESPAPTTRQLAMALVDLILQMTEGNTIVIDLIKSFSQEYATLTPLLDILILLPEEIYNQSLGLGDNRRQELKQYFGSCWSDVLAVLAGCLSLYSSNTEIVARVYACVGNWMQLGNIPALGLEKSPLVLEPFCTLKLLEVPVRLYDAAGDCICSLFYICEKDDYTALADVLHAHVLDLLPVFRAAIQSEDYNRANVLCLIFTEMAETFLYHLVHQPGVGLGNLVALDLLLECVSQPDYEIAKTTFNVWFHLGEELFKVSDSEVLSLFMPYIERLISQLCILCQLDEDTSVTSVGSDGSFDYDTFRTNVVELVRDVSFVVGPLPTFSKLYSNICKPGTAWNVTEACLHIMYAVASSISPDESEVLPIAVPVLLSLPPDSHCALRATTLCLVGELATWIDQHPDQLELVLLFLLGSLNIPSVASFAAKAIQSVCVNCKSRMGPHVNLLVEIINGSDSRGIPHESVLELVKGVVEVLAKQSKDLFREGVYFLCKGPVLHLVEQSSPQLPETSSFDPSVWLDRLAAIFRSATLKDTGEEHPCAAIVVEIHAVVLNACSTFSGSARIVERACRCLRFMIRCVGKGAAPIVRDVLSSCAVLYHGNHSCYLYLGSIVVDEFGADPKYHQLLLEFVEAVSKEVFKLLCEPGGLVNYPATVDDAYRLFTRLLERCPVVFLSSTVVEPATKCALVAATTTSHRDGYSSVMKYFRDFVTLEEPAIAFLEVYGASLMDALLYGVVNLPTILIVESAQVLYKLLQRAREAACLLLVSSLDKLQSSNPKVSQEQQSQFCASVAGSESAEGLARKMKEFARRFR